MTSQGEDVALWPSFWDFLKIMCKFYNSPRGLRKPAQKRAKEFNKVCEVPNPLWAHVGTTDYENQFNELPNIVIISPQIRTNNPVGYRHKKYCHNYYKFTNWD